MLLRGCMTHPILPHQRGLLRSRGCVIYPLQHLFWKRNACSPANHRRCWAAPAPQGVTALCFGCHSSLLQKPAQPPLCKHTPQPRRPESSPAAIPLEPGQMQKGLTLPTSIICLKWSKLFLNLCFLYFTLIFCCSISFSWPRLALESKGLEVCSHK